MMVSYEEPSMLLVRGRDMQSSATTLACKDVSVIVESGAKIRARVAVRASVLMYVFVHSPPPAG
jgi:hypothetical protein